MAIHNHKKTVLITGTNRGVGLCMVKYYLDKGYHVIAVCRNISDSLSQIKKTNTTSLQVVDGIDITDQNSINHLVNEIQPQKIDILINNAGQWCNDSLNDFNLEQMLNNMKVNAFGSLAVTYALLPLLSENSKIIMMTSKMGSISDNQSGGRYGYRMSKAALNAAAKSLSIDLKDQDISVAIIHPGWVQTDMGGPNALIDAKTSVTGIASIIEQLNTDNSGSFYNYDGQIINW
ncbi:SDR family oxidoreductase [Thiotrichales bacterium 19X7-9]|nr:SDR family oxidoreductase [Thiotrichales bacterium 19X7-9]